MNRFFQDKRYKTFLAILCAAGWSLAYPLIKVGYRELRIAGDDLGGKLLFAGIRFLLAGLLVSAFCVFGKIPLEAKSRKDLRWLVLLAVVNTTLHYMFSYIGLGYNPSARSTILDSMGTFFLILLSVLFFRDDKLTPRKLAGCLLGLLGIVLINVQPGGGFFENITFLGDGMILLNALCAAFGGVITRVVSRKMNIMAATGRSMALGGVLLIVFALLAGPESHWNVTGRGILILTALFLISAVCFAVYNELLSFHPISEIAIYNSLIPVLGVMFAALLLKEELKWQYFVSVLLVAAGICLVNRREKQVSMQPRHRN